MNPASFPKMGGQGMAPQGHPGAPQAQQRVGIGHQAVQQQIFRMLSTQQSQQNLQGWQASVPIQQRVYIIYQLVSSLRLIKPQMDVDETVRVALGFEQRTMFDSPDKAAYDLQCRQKIAEIAQTRSKIATSVQQQAQNGQPPMNLGQPQVRMQGIVPNPDQAQMQQRFPNGQMPWLNQTSANGVPNQQHMSMGNPQARIQAVPPNMPQMVPPPGQFTQQDLEEISQLAQHMAQTTPPEQLNHIRTRLENNPQRQQILAQGLDPLTQWFKQQATRRYVEMRRAQAQRSSQVVQAPNNVNLEQPRPMSQNTAHTQGSQVPAASAAQSFDPGFMGNVGQIIALQQNAQRLAEAGHAVVPASNVQAMGEQQRTAMRVAPQQPNQPNATRPPQTPNVPQQPQAFWNAQGQQQPAGQVQNQSQPNLFPNVATPIPTHLQGQVGGLNTPIGRMQPQNTNMPTLTRGVCPPSQTPQPQGMWPQQGTPQMQNTAQGTAANSQQSNPNGAPQRPRPPPGKMNHAQLQQYVNTLPETERRSFIMHLQQQQQQQRAAAGGLPPAGRPESVSMQTQRSQPGQAGSQPTSQLPGHSLNGTQQPNGLQQQQLPAQQPGHSQRPPQQLGDAAQMARQRQQAALASGSLTPEMERAMDKYPYPPGILNANNALSKLPSTVKAWGQLKAWVKDNAASLPPGSEGKLRGLQGLHYQSLSQRQQNNQQQQPGMQPTAQMIRPNQQAVPAQLQMPNMAPPTIQEIHMMRSKIPQLQSATDEQIRNVIIKQRHDAWARARQPALTPQQQAQMQSMQERQHQMQLQQQQQNLQNQSQQHDAQPSQAPQGQAGPQKSQPQQPKKGPQAKEQPQGKAPQAPMQIQATNKGIKRGSSDDVVEVPDPKLAQQQRSQAVKASQKPNAPSMRAEQTAQTAQKQKGGQGAEQRAKAAQSTQAQQGNQITNATQAHAKSEETIQLEAKLRKLIEEVSQSTPQRQPIPMDVGARNRMIPKLVQAQGMLARLDTALPLFYRMFGAEDITRELIRTRLLLKAQHNDANQPINNFTISSEELDKSCNLLYRSFSHIMTRVNQEKEKAEKAKGNATQDGTQGPQTQQQPAKQQPPVLSAANLQQHQNNMQAERQASVQKSHHNNNRAPPAPTSDKPPYTFGLGAQSPHGIPVYGPNELTQDNLKLPINKKRKTNNQPTSSASTPAQQAGTPHQKPSPQFKTDPSSEVQRAPAPIMHRCMVPKCSSGAVGFGSQHELDRHHVDVHQPKEPVIEDPLQFSLEQMRFALNLDENGKAKVKANGAAVPANLGASVMKKSSSMQGTPVLKQETATTPMSRAPTLTGPSPASHLLKTPQASGNPKTPVPETKSLPKDPVAAKAPNPVIVTEDPWADSLIQQDTIHEAFSGLSSLNGPKAWTKIQDFHLTPESMSSDNTTSPRPSDISENDLVKINMDMGSVDEKSWIPVSWSDPMMTELEELDLGGENWAAGAGAGTEAAPDMMDWETLFGESGEEAQERARVAQRKYMRDPHGPTEEWLKVYGPMWGLEDEEQRR